MSTSEEFDMDERSVIEVLEKPISQELLGSHIPARLAYAGLDGDPRVVPVGFLWTHGRIVVGTVPASAKVSALQHNPRVALTIDTQGYPPKVLLIRGSASVEILDGVPADYIAASRKLVPADQFAGWEAGVRALYSTMAMITISPDWAKLLDFETTVPKAVQDLIAAYGDPR
jgi:pyridoxamine 5'-phosphate oxidase-like protein